MATIGKNIKDRRLELGLTQEELATKMGYKSKSAINKIELGVNDVSQSKVVKFAEVLRTTPAHLMGWDREPEDQAEIDAEILTDPELMDMIYDYRKMSAEKKKALRQMAKALASD